MHFTIEDEKIIANLSFGPLPISTEETEGYRPFQLFVSSLIGCSGVLLRKILIKKRHPYEQITMEADVVRNPQKANRIEKIAITAHVHSEKRLSEEQAEKIIRLVMKNCGMIQSVIQSIDITFSIHCVKLIEG